MNEIEQLSSLGLNTIGRIKRNHTPEQLIESAIRWKEGELGTRGELMVDTGKYTGRSPLDKFLVKEDFSGSQIWWGTVNQPTEEKVFDELLNKIIRYYNENGDNRGAFIFDGYAGADPKYRLNVRVIARKAWQAIFANNMFIRPDRQDLNNFKPDFTIINASEVIDQDYAKHGLRSETFIIFNLKRQLAIIGGSEYGGEIKKGIFSIMHYYLPMKGVLSMHCSANVDSKGENPTLFFGLSGTGKTTLSTDSYRPLIGDDEHGWSDDGIFNFEGGCYAKAINLDPAAEPEIYNAIRHGSLAENVVYDPDTRIIDYADKSKTENTRICYPIEFIDNSLAANGKPSITGHPRKIIFLACDAYGILPPVSLLSPEQAMYHFISGYTAKVAGTERGITDPVATFSPCYGGPFLTLHPLKYAELLREKMNKYSVPAYLVNTGWIGVSATSGAKRIRIAVTRKIIHAILDNSIQKTTYETDPYFGVRVPTSLKDINPALLIPKNAWKDENQYHLTARELVKKFQDNYDKYDTGDYLIKKAGPTIN